MSIEISTGGRVKAAGLSYAMFTEPAQQYISSPSVDAAEVATIAYARLRKQPPEEVRDRFFPRSSSVAAFLKRGPGLARTCLKNDQGVGTFLTHRVVQDEDQVNPLRIDVQKETGFTILEEHLARQLVNHPDKTLLSYEINEVKRLFAEGNLASAQKAYEQLISTGSEHCIQVQREAFVGREGFFFIHPSIPQQPVEIGRSTHEMLRKKGESLGAQMIEVAREKRDQFAAKYRLTTGEKRDFAPLYFQVDFMLAKNGSASVADVGLPDVGFFLGAIDSEGNQTVASAQQTVIERLESVTGAMRRKMQEHRAEELCFITRAPVIHNAEDTLEIHEIDILRKALFELGIKTQVISEADACYMDQGQMGILMNIDTTSQSFGDLLMKRVYDESIPIYPDPFLLLGKNELTDLPQICVPGTMLYILQSLFKPYEQTNPAVKLAAFEGILQRLGMPEGYDILHVYNSLERTPKAFYRYDLQGLDIAIYQEDPFSSKVVIRGYPINKDNEVLFDAHGKPMFTTFRYMFNQKI